MGANASTANGADAADEQLRSGGPTDYYQLLGVEVEATSEEIRKAFRREALKWHPDKNAGSEEASKRFIKIQAAYDVLSDNQERAYYDSHRGDLGGELSGNNFQRDDEDEGDLRQRAQQASNAKQSVRISAKQLTRFFDGSLWNNDFSDSSEGFYGIYRTLFETINQSEVYATAPAGEPPLSPPVHYPTFGNSTTQYDAADGELKRFYSSFLSFASRRPFNEADKYRLQDAPDRQVRRLMERENKRARDDARKEYNEAVRSLAAFLKKRDPRFLNSAASDPVKLKHLEKKRLEAQLRDAAIQAAKKREEAAKAFVEQDWMKVKTSASADAEWNDGEDEEEENKDEAENGDLREHNGMSAADDPDHEEPVDDWYCAACDKMFNSQGAWDNHERSRKHLQNTKRLRKEMLAEDESLATSQELPTPEEEHADSNGDPELDDLEREFRKLSKKDRKRFKLQKPSAMAFELMETAPFEVNLNPDHNEAQSDDLGTPLTNHDEGDESNEQVSAGAGAVDGAADVASPQLSKRDKRRAREAAKKAAQLDSPAEEVRKATLSKNDVCAEADIQNQVCRVCNKAFPSRTQLFTHIEETGHASATGESFAQETQGKGRKKGKRK
ncbi:DnaJ-domain-containing protein [Cystobasidium minutum MCA 4210]|uniref:DnaJ-domain-containing protein n=1 Tax=Cystobasidium minutum MCA 4210 TaxID=1397322 RepID=UPI0034CD759B|eukprot:jgi/Rhomi1/181763/fgenesh1_pg.8_\